MPEMRSKIIDIDIESKKPYSMRKGNSSFNKRINDPNINADGTYDDSILRHRIHDVEIALKDRVRYFELNNYRLKADKIDLSDLDEELKELFLNDETIKKLQEQIDLKASIEQLEELKKVVDTKLDKASIDHKLDRVVFEDYKASANRRLQLIENTNSVQTVNIGVLGDEIKALNKLVIGKADREDLDNKVNISDFEALEERVDSLSPQNLERLIERVASLEVTKAEKAELLALSNTVNNILAITNTIPLDLNDQLKGLNSSVNGLRRNKADIEDVEILDDRVSVLEAIINNGDIDIPSLPNFDEIIAGLNKEIVALKSNKADKTLVESLKTKVEEQTTLISELQDVIEGQYTVIEGLMARVERLEGFHTGDTPEVPDPKPPNPPDPEPPTDPDPVPPPPEPEPEPEPQEPWEFDFVLPKLTQFFKITDLVPELDGKVITEEDIYGPEFDGVGCKVKLYYLGVVGGQVEEPPIRIPLTGVEEPDPRTKVLSLSFIDKGNDSEIEFGSGFVSDLNIRIKRIK